MFVACKLKCVPLTSFVSALQTPISNTCAPQIPSIICRAQYASRNTVRSGRTTVTRATRGTNAGTQAKQTFKEKLMAPAGTGAISMGQGLVAGSSVLGLGALCYYGLGLSNQVGAIDRAALWPETVRQRVRTTYMYFGGSIAVTAGAAMACYRSPFMINMMSKNSMMAMVGTIGAMIGSNMLLHSLPYKEGFGSKQMAWILHSGIVGAVIAPLTLMGGPLVVRAAAYTAGVVGGLSMLAICAPSDKFLNMGGPLAMGLGVVFMSSIGSAFLPPSTALGAGLYSISMYGGLVLFGMFLLYDTQKILRRAESHPTYAVQPFDPINNSTGIYMDTINIFIRILMIMMGNKRK